MSTAMARDDARVFPDGNRKPVHRRYASGTPETDRRMPGERIRGVRTIPAQIEEQA